MAIKLIGNNEYTASTYRLVACVCFHVNQEAPGGQQAMGGDVEENSRSGNSQNPGERKGDRLVFHNS